jgi:hypothetical protein
MGDDHNTVYQVTFIDDSHSLIQYDRPVEQSSQVRIYPVPRGNTNLHSEIEQNLVYKKMECTSMACIKAIEDQEILMAYDKPRSLYLADPNLASPPNIDNPCLIKNRLDPNTDKPVKAAITRRGKRYLFGNATTKGLDRDTEQFPQASFPLEGDPEVERDATSYPKGAEDLIMSMPYGPENGRALGPKPVDLMHPPGHRIPHSETEEVTYKSMGRDEPTVFKNTLVNKSRWENQTKVRIGVMYGKEIPLEGWNTNKTLVEGTLAEGKLNISVAKNMMGEETETVPQDLTKIGAKVGYKLTGGDYVKPIYKYLGKKKKTFLRTIRTGKIPTDDDG